VTLVFAGITVAFGWSNLLNWIVFVCVVASFVSFMYGVRGYWLCFVFSIISYGIYIPFCIIYKYYGELAISIITIIISFITMFKWKSTTKNQVAKINKLGWLEIAICYGIFGLAGSVAWGILWLVGSACPLLNGISIVAVFLSYYFDYRISRQAYVFLLLNYIAYCVLWILAGIKGETSGVVLLSIGSVIEMGYVIFGFFRWGKLWRDQNPKEK